MVMSVVSIPMAADAKVANAELETIARDALATQAAPGIAYAVISHGKLVYAGGFGVADVATKKPVTTDTRFAIGSLSKQFTAAAILLLAQQHKLSLEDPLAKYLPQLPNAATITLRMLLNQTSGLHNYPSTKEHAWPLEGAIGPAALFAFLATDKPDFAPGTQWAYSNTNYAALADVVAKASGVSFAEFMSKQVFAPLQMGASGSGFVAQRELATAYAGVGKLDAERAISLDLSYGAGGVVSTLSDLVKWDLALMSGALLNAASMRELWTAGKLTSGAPVSYAMGFVPAQLLGHREVWHNGLTPGAGGYTYNAIFPDDQLAVIVLSNGSSFRGEPEKIVERTLRAYFPAIPAKAPVVDNPADNALARLLFSQLQSGTLDRSKLTDDFNKSLTAALIEQLRPQITPLGAPTALTLEDKKSSSQGAELSYVAQFAAMKLHIRMFIATDGKVAGYGLSP
jgi:CubicO group peptidase (beta-lactamase class C family)